MGRRVKTVALRPETYRAVVEFKERLGLKTFDETVEAMLRLSKIALAAEAAEYVSNRQLTPQEREALEEARKRLREEGAWLRRE